MEHRHSDDGKEEFAEVVEGDAVCLPWFSSFSRSFRKPERLREVAADKFKPGISERTLSTETIPMVISDDCVILGPFGSVDRSQSDLEIEFNDLKHLSWHGDNSSKKITRMDFYSCENYGIVGIGCIYGASARTFHGCRSGTHHIISLVDNDSICQIRLYLEANHLYGISLTSSSGKTVGPYGYCRGDAFVVGSSPSSSTSTTYCAKLMNISGIEINQTLLSSLRFHFTGLDPGLIKREVIVFDNI